MAMNAKSGVECFKTIYTVGSTRGLLRSMDSVFSPIGAQTRRIPAILTPISALAEVF
jgi:hypothetical protein